MVISWTVDYADKETLYRKDDNEDHYVGGVTSPGIQATKNDEEPGTEYVFPETTTDDNSGSLKKPGTPKL